MGITVTNIKKTAAIKYNPRLTLMSRRWWWGGRFKIISGPKFSITCSTNIFTQELFPDLSREFKSRACGSDEYWPDQKQCAHIVNVSRSFLRTPNMDWRPRVLTLLEVKMATSSGYCLPSTSRDEVMGLRGIAWWQGQPNRGLFSKSSPITDHDFIFSPGVQRGVQRPSFTHSLKGPWGS